MLPAAFPSSPLVIAITISVELAHIDGGFADGAVTVYMPMQIVRSLTNSGHNFLDNIRSDDIWSKVKKQAGELSEHLGLPVIAAVAEATVKKHFGLT